MGNIGSALIQFLFSYRRYVIVAIHIILVTVAYYLAFLLRFDLRLPAVEWDRFFQSLPLLLLIKLFVFGYFHLYEGLWQYVSMRDILAILKAGTLSSMIFAAGILVVIGHGFPRSVLLLDWVFCLALVGGVRLTIRALRESTRKYPRRDARRALVVGAGDAGEMLIREIVRGPKLDYEVVGFVDDDPNKHGTRIHGIPVVGTIDHLPHLCRSQEIQELLIAIPSASKEQRQRILVCCRESGVPFKTVPALNELLLGKAIIGQLQEVRPEDLLGREAIRLDFDRIRSELHGKRVLVTGAGGSIGSELCRQLATFEPEMIVLLERAESSLYFADLELRRLHPRVRIIPVVGDIQNRFQMEEVMRLYALDLVYHAAAFKHVPLMEDHPLEAIQNNIFGTETVALAARAANVKKFIFISTDKAVRPVGIMGMTKRVAECLLLSLNSGPTLFVAVRFGNVLGSDGSVLPIFQRQIAQGGPVTVTDTEASRYFMLLSEAAQLVLQAGVMGKGGEVFFLDMGEPINILDLARNLIRLSGLEQDGNIPVEVVGLRPGEGLREELVREKEKLLPSDHEKVFIVQNHQFDAEAFEQDLEALRRYATARDPVRAVQHLQLMAAGF